jgi:hypothetical protein
MGMSLRSSPESRKAENSQPAECKRTVPQSGMLYLRFQGSSLHFVSKQEYLEPAWFIFEKRRESVTVFSSRADDRNLFGESFLNQSKRVNAKGSK